MSKKLSVFSHSRKGDRSINQEIEYNMMSMGQKREHRGWKNEFCLSSRLYGVRESIREEVGGEIEWGSSQQSYFQRRMDIPIFVCVCVCVSISLFISLYHFICLYKIYRRSRKLWRWEGSV